MLSVIAITKATTTPRISRVIIDWATVRTPFSKALRVLGYMAEATKNGLIIITMPSWITASII